MHDFPSTAIITGASRGMGALIAEALAKRGTALVLAARAAAGLAATHDRCAAHGHAVHVVPTDVAEPRQLDALVAAAADRLGALDLLINNAGIEEVGFF
jgi:3-oxoacyl-[acyl-carrier protein] reductase